MTKWIWPKIFNKKKSHRRTLTFKLDRKYNKSQLPLCKQRHLAELLTRHIVAGRPFNIPIMYSPERWNNFLKKTDLKFWCMFYADKILPKVNLPWKCLLKLFAAYILLIEFYSFDSCLVWYWACLFDYPVRVVLSFI